ncbi:MAG: hypothetical protein AAF806_21005 [Bacteroidota bacterium]
MKKILLISIILMIAASVQSQSDNLGFSDIYGLSITFKEKVFSDKCGCEVNRRIIKNCHLYLVDIDSVYFMLDSTVYETSKILKEIDYVMISDEYDSEIDINKTYFVTGVNSSVKEYLVLNKIFDYDELFDESHKMMVHVSGLIDCKMFNFFQKILLSLNINREKIYAKAPSLDKNKNPFWFYINSIQ